jgi:hypothetical protein
LGVFSFRAAQQILDNSAREGTWPCDRRDVVGASLGARKSDVVARAEAATDSVGPPAAAAAAFATIGACKPAAA